MKSASLRTKQRNPTADPSFKRRSPDRMSDLDPPGNSAHTDAPKENRLSRTRHRTRGKLIAAARSVMGTKGYEAATINDITEQADVGFGTFYNHFQSKEEIARAVFSENAERLAVFLESVRDALPDVALAQSIVQRLWIEMARRDPLWGWFIVHTEVALQQMNETFASLIAADIRIGNEQGRYHVEAVELAASLTISMLVATMRLVLEGRGSSSAANETSEFLLRMFGLPPDEARDYSWRALPKDVQLMLANFPESNAGQISN
ncbi:TetR/AcrR family transcriptional regulator [Achromobacter xylosoxidans]|uniref:TetR/AcrR family transcriptional regulator n=1 Tax=Alcaligenes xylosoxydans xylosoxydans TaxID=85698 RepID=UPI000ADD7D0A|nr:TetR/AcrR family transcriptional regulator [Achromobacter xylosoxidans]